MSDEFTLLVDDQDPRINYLCPTLNQQVIGTYSNNTWSTIKSKRCKEGWFEYTFYGAPGLASQFSARRLSEVPTEF